VHWKRGCHCER